jgi:putative ABC transport system substrate-binding protein
MRRRDFVAAAAAAVVWPVVARSQQSERLRRIGVLMPIAESDPDASARVDGLWDGLRKLGWDQGSNIVVDFRWARGRLELLQPYAAELVKARPDVILVNGTPALFAMRKEAGSTPIVFVQVADPVAAGIVVSLAHPGGNITGFTNYEYQMGGKWLELLRDIAPRLSRALVLLNPENVSAPAMLRAVETAAQAVGVRIDGAPVHNDREIERSFDGFAPGPDSGLIVLPDFFTSAHRDVIVRLAARHRMPAIYPFRSFAESGGLMAYGTDTPDMYRRAATYLDQILRGAKAQDLPVQAPIKLQLVINRTTAKALDLNFPVHLLVMADDVVN